MDMREIINLIESKQYSVNDFTRKRNTAKIRIPTEGSKLRAMYDRFIRGEIISSDEPYIGPVLVSLRDFYGMEFEKKIDTKCNKCNKCNIELISGENWFKSYKKRYDYTCRECDVIRTKNRSETGNTKETSRKTDENPKPKGVRTFYSLKGVWDGPYFVPLERLIDT